MAFAPGQAAAQGGNVTASWLGEVATPCDMVLGTCEQTLTGTITFLPRDATTQLPIHTPADFLSCDVEARSSFDADGRVVIDSWEASSRAGHYPHCGESLGGPQPYFEPCGGAEMAGWVIEPGTEWSVGDAFSVRIDSNACFGLPQQEAGPLSFRLDEPDNNPLSTEARVWTLDQEWPTGIPGVEAVLSIELEADATYQIDGPL